MLIDCGEASEFQKVADYLNGMGVSRLDAVVATHPHSDHMGGMSSVIMNYDIGEIIMPHIDDREECSDHRSLSGKCHKDR